MELSKGDIKDVMMDALLTGKGFPPEMRNTMQKLGYTAASLNPSNIGTMLDVLAELIWIRMMAANEEGLDRGVTIDPRDFEVTDELIEKIRKGDGKD